jgi:hypothetical protein
MNYQQISTLHGKGSAEQRAQTYTTFEPQPRQTVVKVEKIELVCGKLTA